MFLKQTTYKPRSGSQSSGTSGPAEQPKEEQKPAQPEGPMSGAIAGRRRSSASSDKFAGLQGLKRSSIDERKAAFHEQGTSGQGVLGGMWNSFTKGTK